MILPVVFPYRVDTLRSVLERFPFPAHFVVHQGGILRVLHHHNTHALVRLSDTQSGSLSIEILQGEIPEPVIQHAFGTDADLSAFYEYAQTNQPLWSVVEPLHGIPVWREESVFHTLVHVIIEQHIAWKNARLAQLRLAEWAGQRCQHDGITLYAMPTPEQLARAQIADLTPLKITFRRMQMLIDIARSIVDGGLDLENWMLLEPETMYENLLRLKGVGHWTAAVVVSRSRGIFRYVAHNDVALQAAVAAYFGVEKSAQATRRVFEQYGDFGGLAAHFTLSRWVLDRYPVAGRSEQ